MSNILQHIIKQQENLKTNESSLLSESLNQLAQSTQVLIQSADAFNRNAIKNDEFLKAQEESKKKEKKARNFENWIRLGIAILAPFIGGFYGVHIFTKDSALKMHFQQEQSTQAYLRQQIQTLDTQIKHKIKKRDDLNWAMTKNRNLIEVGHMYCKTGTFVGDELNYGEKQLDYIYQMVNAQYSTNLIFDKNIYLKTRYFLKLLDENRNACDRKEDYDMKLRLLQRELNELINNSIDLDNQKINNLVKKLPDSFQKRNEPG